jgi:hypothetical protein
MAVDYRPNPDSTQPGKIPKPGQRTTYVNDNGDLFPATIMWVGKTSPNGKLVSVGAERYFPGGGAMASDGALGNPVAVERNGWIYNIEKGKVYYCPCTPFPDHCP